MDKSEIVEIKEYFDEKFKNVTSDMNKKFDNVSIKFDQVNNRIDELNEKFNNVNSNVNELKNQVGINCKKLDTMQENIDNLPVKIKQELWPQLVREVRNFIHDELDKKH